MYDIQTTFADAASGQVVVTFSEANTTNAGTYAWKMGWKAPGDVNRTVLSGIVDFVTQ
jgi:hypothetical protein